MWLGYCKQLEICKFRFAQRCTCNIQCGLKTFAANYTCTCIIVSNTVRCRKCWYKMVTRVVIESVCLALLLFYFPKTQYCPNHYNDTCIMNRSGVWIMRNTILFTLPGKRVMPNEEKCTYMYTRKIISNWVVMAGNGNINTCSCGLPVQSVYGSIMLITSVFNGSTDFSIEAKRASSYLMVLRHILTLTDTSWM